MRVERSELLHHQYFHLNEDASDLLKVNEDDDENLQACKKLPKLERLVNQSHKDSRQAWQKIPFDQAGDYLQCLPVPKIKDCFLVI